MFREREGSTFAVSSTVTVVGAVVLAGAAMYFFRQPRQLPAPPPVVEIHEKIIKEPGPKVIEYREKAKPKVESEPEMHTETLGDWDGVWTMPGQSVPMFSIKQTRSAFSGTCAPNWSGTYPISYARLRNGKLEFAVTDNKLSRYHFRMELLSNGDAWIVAWMKPEDAVLSLEHAVKAVRTPQQAYLLRVWMESEIARLGQVSPIGRFRRISDPGKQSDSLRKAGAAVWQSMGPSFIQGR